MKKKKSIDADEFFSAMLNEKLEDLEKKNKVPKKIYTILQKLDSDTVSEKECLFLMKTLLGVNKKEIQAAKAS